MKPRITIDLDLKTAEYAGNKEVQKELGAKSRNELVERALKQYDPHRKEVSPQFAAWMERKGINE